MLFRELPEGDPPFGGLVSSQAVFRALSLTLVVFLASPAESVGAQVATFTGKRACSALRTVVGAHDAVPPSKVQKTWFCDPLPDDYGEWTVIGLRSYRRCDGICSNLRGWFAIHKTTGQVRDFNVGDMEVGDERSTYRPNKSLERSRER